MDSMTLEKPYPHRKCKLNRRNALRAGCGGLAGLTLANSLRAQERTPNAVESPIRNLILIWLSGGPATIDMWDPKPDAADNIRGPFQTIDTNVPGIRLSEHMPRLATVMDRCTLVRSSAV